MNRARTGLKALGLCALVVGLMAVAGAGVAQAETGAKWLYENPKTHAKGEFTNELEGNLAFEVENNTAELLVGTTGVGVLCTGLAFDEGGQLAGNGSVLLGRIDFSGCLLTIEGEHIEGCRTNDPTTGIGHILTEKGEGLILLHEGDNTVKISPDNEKLILAKIFTEEECPIAEEIVVEGHLVLWDCNKEGAVLKTSHLIEEYPNLQLMSVGEETVKIDGSANASLTGEHSNYLFAGDPE